MVRGSGFVGPHPADGDHLELAAEGPVGLRQSGAERPPTVFGEGNFRHQVSLGGGRRLSLVAWRMADRLPPVSRPVELAVRLQWNRWQGRRMPQAEVLDWRPG
jgi:single-stranded-DNA-specific exonuclease